jgi:hypothetical protein
MADPQPCHECRKLVVRNKKRKSPHRTLKPVGRKPDIGHMPDIGRRSEYQCLTCETLFIQTSDGAEVGWYCVL